MATICHPTFLRSVLYTFIATFYFILYLYVFNVEVKKLFNLIKRRKNVKNSDPFRSFACWKRLIFFNEFYWNHFERCTWISRKVIGKYCNKVFFDVPASISCSTDYLKNAMRFLMELKVDEKFIVVWV